MLVLSPCLLLLLVIYPGTPVEAKCNEAIVSRIKEYWELNGRPSGVLERTSKVKWFRFFYATPEAVGDGVKCVKARHDYCNGLGPANFYYQDGSYEITVYKIKEENGVLHLTLNGIEYIEYPLFFKHGVFAFYKCPCDSPMESNLAIVAVDMGLETDTVPSLTAAALTEAHDLMTSYGVTDLREVPSCPDHLQDSKQCM